METSIIKIGNSQGMIIPKKLIDQIGIDKKVDIKVIDGTIQITPIEKKTSRKNWEKLFAQSINKGYLPDNAENIENDFDKTEWTW